MVSGLLTAREKNIVNIGPSVGGLRVRHRENSPVTQSTPEPTLLSWGRWPCEKNSPTPGHIANTILSHLLGHSDPIVLKPFHVIMVYHECQISSRFHQILKVILEMAFSAHYSSIWKLNWISRTSINKFAQKCIWCCSRVQGCLVAPHWAHGWGNIVQWGMKAWSR